MQADRSSFLMRLLRDRRAATLPMMAVAVLPLAGMAGSALDLSRLYLVKTRLQQACDAGVLAGRKVLVDSNDTALDAGSAAQAQAFFLNNFQAGWMDTSQTSFTPTKTAANQVAGTARTTVPMTLMRLFDQPARTLTVTCEASFDLPDTDVMFVLDTTGSMACSPADTTKQCTDYVNDQDTAAIVRPGAGTQPGYSVTPGYAGSTAFAVPESPNGSRIAELRTAVQTFYSTMAGQLDPATNVRYGFVTYSSHVNPGQAIMDVAPAMMRGSATSGTTTAPYQSRRVTGEWSISRTSGSDGTSQRDCTMLTDFRFPQPTANNAFTFNTNQRAYYITRAWSAANSRCEYARYEEMGPTWTHQVVDHDVSGFVGGGPVLDPTKLTGVNATWSGCIEERETTAQTLNYNSRSLPADLDPNLVPSTAAQRWAPYWPEVVYNRPYDNDTGRANATAVRNGDTTSTSFNSFAAMNRTDFQERGFVTCGKPVQRLRRLTAQQARAYVTAADFVPHGGTYHDAGMIWGTRMLSPGGPFAADTTTWPGRQPPNRVLVFLTDGDMSPGYNGYTFKGLEILDRRVSGTDYDGDDLLAYHNARFLAVCDWARNNQIDVWTVSITTAVNPNAQLTGCARVPAQAFSTAGQPGRLQTIFGQIARQVASLRITQ